MADEKAGAIADEKRTHPSEWPEREILLFMHNNGINVPYTESTKKLILNTIFKLCNAAAVDPQPEKQEVPGEDSVSTDTAEHKNTEGFFGVAIVNIEGSDDSDTVVPLCPFYTRQESFSKLFGTYKDRLRFRKFLTQEEAEEFHHSLHGKTINNLLVASTEKANNFKEPKQPQLNALKRLIQSGDTYEFNRCVMENPRYLISSGDCPTTIVPGAYYNCLHVAVLANQLAVCRELLSLIDSDVFWEQVYPSDDEETHQMRRKHLSGLYLNRQTGRPPKQGQSSQVQNCDSPLHIASKLGLEDVVKFLLSFSQTDLTVRDRDDKLACEVICNRGGSNQAKAAIRSLFEEPPIYFVSVVRPKDNSTPPRLRRPCGWEESFSPGQRNRPIDSECVNAAMAGPMSPSQAKDLYRRWKALRGESKAGMQMKEIMRMDPTKGMETVGRTLAQGMQVGWSEYWEFLDTRCDLSTPEGMDLLERHISTVSEHSTTPSTGDTPSARIATPPLNQHSGSSPTLSAAKESGKFRSVLPSRSESPFAVEGRRREVEEDSLDDLSGALKQILKFDDEPSTSTPEVSQRKSPRESSGGIEAEGGDVGMCCEPLLSPSTSTAATTCQSSEATERITGIQDATTATTGVKSNSEQQQRDAASKPDPVPFGPDQLLSSSSTGRLRLGVVGKDVRESPSECDPAVPITPDRDPALFCTPRHHRSGNGEQDLAFLMGSEPCKVDSEVLLALGSGEVDAQRYPRVASWQNTVSAYSQLDRKGWPSPRTADYRSVPRRPPGVPAIPLSPLVHSCSPSAYTKNLSSSRSSTPLTVSSSLHATPKRILQGSRMLEPRAI